MLLSSMRKSVILVAGGTGTRMGSDLPKQFLLLEEYPVLMWTILCFLQYDPDISVVVVLPETQFKYWKELCKKFNFLYPHQVAKGGETRFHSVINGIEILTETDLVAIHDGVRPLVSLQTIDNCFRQAAKSGAAIPVLPQNETLRRGTLEQSITVDRNLYFVVQTPQVFKYQLLKNSFLQVWDSSFTDDASVIEKSGFPVTMVPGNRENLKITHIEDMIIANAYIKNKRDIR
jgi:2-C-methyl-D-erythritol 4-phosphate cytidylyltransferase